MKKTFIIKDWADNLCFGGKEFKSFEDAELFLCAVFERDGEDYEEERGEYEIVEE